MTCFIPYTSSFTENDLEKSPREPIFTFVVKKQAPEPLEWIFQAEALNLSEQSRQLK
jgi:hypothetical protein